MESKIKFRLPVLELKGIASGVYCIANILDGRVYIGSSKNIKSRLSGHCSMIKKGNHHSVRLQNFINKYGADKLRAQILERCEPCDLFTREQFWIDRITSRRGNKMLFNTCPYAANPREARNTKQSLHLRRKKRIAKRKVIWDAKQKHYQDHQSALFAELSLRAEGRCEVCDFTPQDTDDSDYLVLQDIGPTRYYGDTNASNTDFLCWACSCTRRDEIYKSQKSQLRCSKHSITTPDQQQQI